MHRLNCIISFLVFVNCVNLYSDQHFVNHYIGFADLVAGNSTIRKELMTNSIVQFSFH